MPVNTAARVEKRGFPFPVSTRHRVSRFNRVSWARCLRPRVLATLRKTWQKNYSGFGRAFQGSIQIGRGFFRVLEISIEDVFIRNGAFFHTFISRWSRPNAPASLWHPPQRRRSYGGGNPGGHPDSLDGRYPVKGFASPLSSEEGGDWKILPLSAAGSNRHVVVTAEQPRRSG